MSKPAPQAFILAFVFIASSAMLTFAPVLGIIPPPSVPPGAEQDKTANLLVAFAPALLFAAFFIRSLILKNPTENPASQKLIATIVAYALMEGCVTLGFVASIMSGTSTHALFLGGVTIACMIAIFPKQHG